MFELSGLIILVFIVSIYSIKKYSKDRWRNKKQGYILDTTWLLKEREKKTQVLENIGEFKRNIIYLNEKQACWEEIYTVLNPVNDKSLLSQLNKYRGPYMFAPHVALNILELACDRAMDSAGAIGVVDVVKYAIEEGNKIFERVR